MGVFTFILGAVVGAGALFFFQQMRAEAIPPPGEPQVLDESVSLFIDPQRISPTRWEFEATYRNRTDRTLRTTLSFQLLNPDNSEVFIQEQDIDIEPGSAVQIFWDSGEISNFTNQEGVFKAVFKVEELFSGIDLARPFEVLFPVELPSPMTISTLAHLPEDLPPEIIPGLDTEEIRIW